MARKKKRMPAGSIDPDFLERQRKALRRTHRYVLYLNDNEKAVIDSYCERFGTMKGKSALMRGIIMEKMLSDLEMNHPTLF